MPGRKSETAQSAYVRVSNQIVDSDLLPILATVAEKFCEGSSWDAIEAAIGAKWPDVARRMPKDTEFRWRLLRAASYKNMLRYNAPIDEQLATNLQKGRKLSGRVSVALSDRRQDLPSLAAENLCNLICDSNRSEVHVGFAGGITLNGVAAALAKALKTNLRKSPDRIVFHALVAGLRPSGSDGIVDPNTFVTHFRKEDLSIQIEFINFPAPGLVRRDQLRALREFDDVQEAHREAEKLDIIVTSGGRDEHSTLRCCLKDRGVVVETESVAGDLLWQLVNKDGSSVIDTEYCAATLITLEELKVFIKKGKRVLLVLDVCLECGHPKEMLLNAAIKGELVTDLVADASTATNYLKRFA